MSERPQRTKLPPRPVRVKTPLSVQIARASWQVILISLVAIGMTLAVKRTELPANLVGNLVIGAVLLCSLVFSVMGLRAAGDDEDNAAQLRRNSLFGFAGVVVLLGLTVANNLGVFRQERPVTAAATPTPGPVAGGVSIPAATAKATARASEDAAPKPAPITPDEARTFARSYIALIKRGEFGEAYRYLPADVQTRVSSAAHEAHWVAAAGTVLEDLEVDAAAPTQKDGAGPIEFRVQIPEKDPQVLLVVGSDGKMSATPMQLAKP